MCFYIFVQARIELYPLPFLLRYIQNIHFFLFLQRSYHNNNYYYIMVTAII